MFNRIKIVGHGRVGTAISARLRERGVGLGDRAVDLVLLCVPDAAIRDAAAAVAAEHPDARARGRWLAEALGLRPFDLNEESRALYHAGAAIASNYLVTLFRSASRLFEKAGAPPEALVALMRRTIDNGFELTGPIARGDRGTIDAHLAAIPAAAPDLEPMYRALAEVTAP
jgi:predicted short-subunit dehydrogenase-like oxidoreductase (DUF2520 family)